MRRAPRCTRRAPRSGAGRSPSGTFLVSGQKETRLAENVSEPLAREVRPRLLGNEECPHYALTTVGKSVLRMREPAAHHSSMRPRRLELEAPRHHLGAVMHDAQPQSFGLVQ